MKHDIIATVNVIASNNLGLSLTFGIAIAYVCWGQVLKQYFSGVSEGIPRCMGGYYSGKKGWRDECLGGNLQIEQHSIGTDGAIMRDQR